MIEDFEASKDVQADSRSASRSLMDEVNSNREDSSKTAIKSGDSQKGSDSTVNSIFGSLQIVEDKVSDTYHSLTGKADQAMDFSPAADKAPDSQPAAPSDKSVSSAAPNNASDSSMSNFFAGFKPEMATNDLSFWHPIDSAKEIYHRVKGDKTDDKPGDKPGDKPADKPADPNDKFPSPEKEHLKQLESKLPPADKAQFDKDMADFEKRAAESKPPMSPEQVSKTYEQISRLMEAQDNPNGPKIDASQRMKIAEQIMNHAAHPEHIDQGQHGSCGAATAESLAFSKDPKDAAKMIVDVALTGEFKDKSGHTVKPDPATLTFGEKHQYDYPPANGERTMASQIFQVTAITMEEPSFKQVTPTGPDDLGERVTKMKDGDLFKKEELPFGGLSNDQITDINKRVTGDYQEGSFITNGKNRPEGFDPNDHKVYADNPQQLGQELERMKKEGKLPAIITVDSQNEPFFSDSHGALAGGKGHGHVVTITDYDPATGKVSVDNQWGTGSDHTGNKAISINDMYRATLPPGDHGLIDNLQKEVAKNKAEGKVDPSLELELLRQKHMATDPADKLSDKQYEDQVKKTMVDALKRWDAQEGSGTVSEDERRRTWVKYAEMAVAMPNDQGNKAMQQAVGAELQATRKHHHNMKNPQDYYMEYKKELDGDGTSN